MLLTSKAELLPVYGSNFFLQALLHTFLSGRYHLMNLSRARRMIDGCKGSVLLCTRLVLATGLHLKILLASHGTSKALEAELNFIGSILFFNKLTANSG